MLAESAGILFTRHALTGADERVIEGSYGLGEDIAIEWAPVGGTREVDVAPERAAQLCLGDAELAQLEALAAACEAAFPGPHDLEWAFAAGQLYLLQRRAITRG